MKEVHIIGAGVAGLVAAYELEQKGYTPTIFEQQDLVGGRVTSQIIEGHKLDRGFQVLLTAYPEAQRYLEYRALKLNNFQPGAVIFKDGKKIRVADPLRQPTKLFTMLFSGMGSVGDKLKIFLLSRKLKRKSIEQIFSDKEVTTMQYLKDYGFSEKVIGRFFKPFFSGIFLEDQLHTSSRMFEFVFKMFAEGHAAIPEMGIHEVSKQLAGKLKKTKVIIGNCVQEVAPGMVKCTQQDHHSNAIIIATDPSSVLRGMQHDPTTFHQVQNLVYEVDQNFIGKPLIGLSADEDSLVNNFHYINDITPEVAGSNKLLLSVSVVKNHNLTPQQLIDQVAAEMKSISGGKLNTIKHVHTFNIRKALPQIEDIQDHITPSHTRIHENIFLAGDYLLNGSLNAAMKSGRLAAEAAHEYLERQVQVARQ